jgi:hypothetical protein
MMKKENRLNRERETIKVMVNMYCRSVHSSSGIICSDCQSLLDYACLKIDHCLFGSEKPACSECCVHCYEKEKRESIKMIMRYAGPRMLYKYPCLGIMHFVNKYCYRATRKR